MIYAVFRAGVRLIALVILGRRLHIEGMEHVPPRGPVLIVGNHVGNVEPVASWGSEKVIPRGAWFPRRADVYLRIGQPFHLPATGSDGRPLTNHAASAYMMERVNVMLPESRRASVAAATGSPPAA